MTRRGVISRAFGCALLVLTAPDPLRAAQSPSRDAGHAHDWRRCWQDPLVGARGAESPAARARGSEDRGWDDEYL